ncbi:MAG TPA: DUF488 domain-containing protein [Thermomicrobiaceae bacterium]|nr:DUF488 domain-containing protein [Thermomicrobiaceae bacterium]
MIYTIGHSTHPIEEFLELLRQHGITLLADVRTVPRSRKNPQFNRETLPASLGDQGIEYRHLAALGGLRKTSKDSPNLGWRNASFRGYADYMQTQEFVEGLLALIDLANEQTVAIMCAESLPWRCHRWLVADALVVRGIDVEHIMSNGQLRKHALTSFAVVDGLTVTYPPEGPEES